MTRPLIFGVVNVTPDSFSDGGNWLAADAAVEHGIALARDGADVLDIGGESTRPGATRVDGGEELRRVLPVVRRLTERGLRVSIDTMRAETATAAVAAGAEFINDVSGGLADPGMAAAAAASGARFIAGHWRGPSDVMDAQNDYGNIVADVARELGQRVDHLVAAGVARDRISIDPGLGFAKPGAQNWVVLAGLPRLVELGLPVMVGASRKRFLGALLPDAADVTERDALTAVTSVLAAQAGVWAVRVHDVLATRRALDVWRAWESGARDEH
ncbi:MAG TPA: dihydropteroate synthase [Candidatus Lumbricidophila sp.]|nr:dihydropteroate synthase [Candidatus Lumbricidophila sp.]